MPAIKTRPEFNVGYTRADFAHSPMLVFYEVTRACDLACAHCRACAQPWHHPEELSGQTSRDLIDQLASFPRKPLLVFTGGDPLKRDDIFELIHCATDAGLETAMTPSATPLVTDDAIVAMRQAGLGRMAVSIDGADAQTHDALRGIEGTFERGLRILRTAGALGMPLQVNTTITTRNFDQIDAMADLFATFGISLWSVFFLIPVGRGVDEHRITPEQYEIAFAKLWRHAQQQPFGVKTTEAHHYRRFVLQQKGNPQASPFDRDDKPLQRAPLGINDGKGVMFISHKGEVHPSGFMPIDCGRFPRDSVVDIYQNNATFKSLRDPDQFDGKCGVCEFRQVCGGSRARAFTVTGNPLGSEPDCVYQPRQWVGATS